MIRIQLSRAKGWKMPPNTVKVSRPSKWGNPYRVEEAPASCAAIPQLDQPKENGAC